MRRLKQHIRYDMRQIRDRYLPHAYGKGYRGNQRADSWILAVTRRLKSAASIKASAVRCMR